MDIIKPKGEKKTQKQRVRRARDPQREVPQMQTPSEDDGESFFALKDHSGLQKYMQTMRISVAGSPGHLFERVRSADFSSVVDDQPTQRQRDAHNILKMSALLVLVVGLFVFTSYTTVDILFWIFLFVGVVWRVDARFYIGAGIACLCLIPLLLLFSAEVSDAFAQWAEQVAVWAYLFLVIGVVVHIRNFLR